MLKMSQNLLKSLLFIITLLGVDHVYSQFNSLPVNTNNVQAIAAEHVTYPEIGSFTRLDFRHPQYRPLVLLPQSPETIDTNFLLYTRKNWNDTQILKQGDLDSIKSSNFNNKNPTKFIVHGFLANLGSTGEWMRQLKNEFLKANDSNVFIVDWSKGNGFPYTQATANTRVVGPVIALFINNLNSIFGIDLSSVHIVGHSLGSHTAGYAGARLNGALGRISGLDPAGPYFEGLVPEAKLDPTDAQFVDAIHSDAKPLATKQGFGMYETSGHLDFYPNGGLDQPGCERFDASVYLKPEGHNEVANRVSCDHSRAIELYIASVNNKLDKGVGHQCPDYSSFLAGKCVDCNDGKCAVLGYEAVLNKNFKDYTKGTRFFLQTIDKYPYFSSTIKKNPQSK